MLRTIRVSRPAKILILACLFLIMAASNSSAQQTGADKPEFNPDTVFTFQSPRPLLILEDLNDALTRAWGFDLIFSGNGFAGGVFWQKQLQEGMQGFVDLYISGAKNSDEFEMYDINSRQSFIPDKINRLYMFPLMFGASYRLFRNKVIGSFIPFITAGAGPTFILSTPYVDEANNNEFVSFFDSFGSAKFFTRFGGFIGIGADIETTPTNISNVAIRYYFIPFGGAGLESIMDLPITDFGGLFLSLSIGFRY